MSSPVEIFIVLITIFTADGQLVSFSSRDSRTSEYKAYYETLAECQEELKIKNERMPKDSKSQYDCVSILKRK